MGGQTTYTQGPAALGLAGQLYDLFTHDADSRLAEGAVKFGRALVKGTASPQVKLPSAAAQVFVGVSLHEHAHEMDAAGLAQYLDKEPVSNLRRGRVVVEVLTAVAEDAPAFFDNGTASAGANAGKFSATDDGTTDAVPTGRFRTATTGAGLAVLEIDLPAAI